MLTSDLVLTRRVKDEVRPRYVNRDDPELLSLAEQLITVFESHAGEPRHSLDDELRELVGTGTDFLLHRALAKLLFDRCEFDTEAPEEPEVLRQRVFEAAAVVYRAPEEEGQTFRFDRNSVLKAVAEEHDLEVSELERGLYADLKDEQVLSQFRTCQPQWLIDRYNVALAQGVVLRATELEIHLTESSIPKQRALFRKIKFFQLLHRVEPDGDGGYRIVLDGPLSLFRSSGRYGVQMASFLPILLHFRHWTLTARLEWGKRRLPALFRLAPSPRLRPTTRLTGQWQPEEVGWLGEQFAKLTTEWTCDTEAEIVPLGGQGVLIPDFVFRHMESGFTVYMEVLGFWRRGALESRLETLREHGPENLLLAVSKKLLTEVDDLEDLPVETYVFRATPVARKVLRHLETLRQRALGAV